MGSSFVLIIHGLFITHPNEELCMPRLQHNDLFLVQQPAIPYCDKACYQTEGMKHPVPTAMPRPPATSITTGSACSCGPAARMLGAAWACCFFCPAELPSACLGVQLSCPVGARSSWPAAGMKQPVPVAWLCPRVFSARSLPLDALRQPLLLCWSRHMTGEMHYCTLISSARFKSQIWNIIVCQRPKRCMLFAGHLHCRLVGRVLLAPADFRVAPRGPWAVPVPRSADGLLFFNLLLD